jgi:hypothetical protein
LQLRREGMRLSKDEREALPALIGHMVVDGPNNRTCGHLLCASFYDLSGGAVTPRLLHRPLIDPCIIHMDDRGMVFPRV